MPPLFSSLTRRLALWNRRRLHRRHRSRRRPYADWCRLHDVPTPAQLAGWQAAVAGAGGRIAADLLLLADEDLAHGWLPALQAQLLPSWRLLVLPAPGQRATWSAMARDEPRVQLLDDLAEAQSWLAGPQAAPWCAWIDADERWRPHTLLALLAATSGGTDIALVYGDEDRIDATGRRSEPWFKPDFDADALWALDAVGTPALWRSDRLAAALAQPLTEGARRHDLVLRAARNLAAAAVRHVPGVLAHRLAPPARQAVAAARAVQAALDRAGIAARAEPDADPAAAREGLVRVRFALPQPPPLVSLIVPTRNGLHLLRRAVEGLLNRTDWPRLEVLIVDNGSDDPACLAWMAQTAATDPRVRVLRDERPFNFAALNNAAVRQARGEVLALVNNDVDVLAPGWLAEMVSLALQPGVGAVGARLWYEDFTLQHGGVLLGIGEVAAHVLRGLPRGEGGPAARALRLQGYLAVTAACLVLRREHWDRVGGMDETLAVAFNDIDLCLKLAAAGLRNLWTPHAELIHFESVSRGRDHDPAKKARYLAEAAVMLQRWGSWIAADPFYNPCLSAEHDDFSLAEPPRLAR